MKRNQGVVVLVAFLAFVEADAAPVLTIQCEEPKGHRFDVFEVDGRLRESDDTFTGVRPLFVLDDAKPNVLLVVWGDSTSNPLSRGTTTAKDAVIVSFTETQITAVFVADRIVAVYTIFPRTGVMFMTDHSAMSYGPSGRTFYAKCQVASDIE